MNKIFKKEVSANAMQLNVASKCQKGPIRVPLEAMLEEFKWEGGSL